MSIWPFSLTPQGLGLKGKDREKAQAYYELAGEDLDYKLLELDKDNLSDSDYNTRKMKLDIKYKDLSEKELESAKLSLRTDTDTDDYKIAVLDFKKKHEEIDEKTYSKELANIKQEPWVDWKEWKLHKSDDESSVLGIDFELDWNEFFIKKLHDEGYEGKTSEELVKRWYAELCRVVALEEGLALDLFSDEYDEVLIRKEDLGNGKATYS